MQTRPIELCSHCFRPVAIAEQWRAIKREGRPNHLCWGFGAGCEDVDTYATMLARIVERTAERDRILATL